MSKDMEKIGDFMKQLMPDNADEIASILPVTKQWKKILLVEFNGIAKLAGHARMHAINGSTMIVDINHPGWKQYFVLHKRKILLNLKKYAPELQIKRFQIRLVDDFKSVVPEYEPPKPKKIQKPVEIIDGETPSQRFLRMMEDNDD